MWQQVEKVISEHESFVITSHVNPDGDAIGSEMALKAFLEDRGKRVVVVNSSPMPDSIQFLDPDHEIKIFGKDVDETILDKIDAAFIVDLNNWPQIGEFAQPLKESSLPRVCIDHHQGVEQSFADVIISDTGAAATGILIFEMIEALGGSVSRSTGDALYATIITDTGTFRFSNTDARTFRTAAALVDRGVDTHALYRQVFASKSWGTGRLLGPVMQTLTAEADGRLAWICATRDMVMSADASYDDMDGFIDLVRAIKGVELVLFFKETSDGEVKVSLRSNGNVDAFAVARHFGGGGHKMASGVRLSGPVDVAIKKVVSTCLQMDGIKSP